ncbi:MAG TPA: hypothetical protein PLC99_18980 [Verrucomicrobiota bacterium]|nr:hypothetical protein [Verrucomicrobiota bacterium]
MKLPLAHAAQPTPFRSRPRHRQRGSAVIIVLALLVIMLIYVAGNIRTLQSLGRELRLIEQQQTQRLKTVGRATNAPPASIITTNTASLAEQFQHTVQR